MNCGQLVHPQGPCACKNKGERNPITTTTNFVNPIGPNDLTGQIRLNMHIGFGVRSTIFHLVCFNKIKNGTYNIKFGKRASNNGRQGTIFA